MSGVGPGDGFRALEDVTAPDPRQSYYVLPDVEGGEYRPPEHADLHGVLDRLELAPDVPTEVRIQFDNARNLLLYSWFVYRFVQPAELQALRTLEFALRERVLGKKPGQRKAPSLGTLIDRAFSGGHWTRERLKARLDGLDAETARASITYVPQNRDDDIARYLKGLFRGLRRYRNDLAHGGSYLMPGGLYVLAVCHLLIEELYSGA